MRKRQNKQKVAGIGPFLKQLLLKCNYKWKRGRNVKYISNIQSNSSWKSFPNFQFRIVGNFCENFPPRFESVNDLLWPNWNHSKGRKMEKLLKQFSCVGDAFLSFVLGSLNCKQHSGWAEVVFKWSAWSLSTPSIRVWILLKSTV